MEKLLELLKRNEIEVTDALRGEIKSIWPDTEGMFDQEKVNEIVQKRLERERGLHEQEVEELRGKIKNLVDPNQYDQLKSEMEASRQDVEKRYSRDKKMYEVKLAAAKEQVNDLDYLEYLADKEGWYDRITDDLQVDVGGEKKPITYLIEQTKEKRPEMFGVEKKQTKGTNPPAKVDEKNPWRKGEFNITEQMEIYREDPELARRLKNEAKE